MRDFFAYPFSVILLPSDRCRVRGLKGRLNSMPEGYTHIRTARAAARLANIEPADRAAFDCRWRRTFSDSRYYRNRKCDGNTGSNGDAYADTGTDTGGTDCFR